MTDDAHLVVPESLHERLHVARHRRFRITLRRIRLPGAAQVGGDDRVTLRELPHQRPPHVAGLPEAVQQQHRLSLPCDEVVEPNAVRLREPTLDLGLLRQGDCRAEQERRRQGHCCQILTMAHHSILMDASGLAGPVP